MLALLAALLLEEPEASLAFVGDVMVGRGVEARLQRSDALSLAGQVSELFEGADFVVGNLEAPLTLRPFTVNKRILLRADPERASWLKKAGFHAFSLANNHSLDCGPEGLADTERSLADVGIDCFGQNERPLVKEVAGVRVAFLGLMDFPRDAWGVLPLLNEPSLERQIPLAKAEADIVIVSVHWGVEGSAIPTERQKAMATAAARSGADIVVGHGPHVLQNFQMLYRAGANTKIHYSLGNFIFDSLDPKEKESQILMVKVRRSGVVSSNHIYFQIDSGLPRKAATAAPVRRSAAAPLR